MCSGSEAGSYLRLIDFVHHSTLGLRVIKKRREGLRGALGDHALAFLYASLEGLSLSLSLFRSLSDSERKIRIPE